jgi:GDP-4-dehydro-6-deoxy-D-mannose reductase
VRQIKVLVTGAGGFVGGYLVSHLLESGHEVVATSLELPPFAEERPVLWEALDLTDRPRAIGWLNEVEPEGIVHLAAQASVGGSWENPAATYRSNIEGTGNLLDAVKELRPRVLLIGSAQQYVTPAEGRPLTEDDPQQAGSPYALSKIAQEQMGLMYLSHFGLPSVFARSFNHTGPGQSAHYAVGSFASQIAELERSGGGEMHVGNLDSRRDFLDVRDVVRAYLMLLERGTAGEAYNVCSGRAVRMGDVLDKLLEVAGIGENVQVHRQSRHVPASADLLVGDPTKLQTAVGWAPEISLDRSLVDTLNRYRSDLEGRK